MITSRQDTILEQCRAKLRDIIFTHNLNDVELQVLAKTLTPEEAIGTPGRRDFPIIVGKERVIEAVMLGARGQAFTDSPSEYVGRLRNMLELPLASNHNRALMVATLNAVLRYLDLVDGTVHCKDDDPEKCAAEIASHCRESGADSVGLIGLNPAIAEALAGEFGANAVQITDLDMQNIGKRKFNIEMLMLRREPGVGNGIVTQVLECPDPRDNRAVSNILFLNGFLNGFKQQFTRLEPKYHNLHCSGILHHLHDQSLHRLCGSSWNSRSPILTGPGGGSQGGANGTLAKEGHCPVSGVRFRVSGVRCQVSGVGFQVPGE